MLHIEIETVWRFHREGSPQTVIVMLGILNEIRKTGKLTSGIRPTPHALCVRQVTNLFCLLARLYTSGARVGNAAPARAHPATPKNIVPAALRPSAAA